jgi:hypothetical protein
VSGDELVLQLQEPNYEDGGHVGETVNWMVVEAGTWRLADGTLLEAGTLRSDKLSSEGFEQVSFGAEFDDRPVVLSQVQTDNGGDFVVTRQTGADADGFRLMMQEEEALNGGGHTTETLGWIAIEEGAGSTGGFDWIAGRAGGIDDDRAVIDLSSQLSGGVNAIASLSSYAGADPAWARGDGETGGRVGISVEEDQSRDDETSHARETVDYFVFNKAGTISGTPVETPAQTVAETGTLTLTHIAQTITLGREYENPVALAWVATENGGDPVTVRLGEVSGDELVLQLQEPNYEDGGHIGETVNWMVVEAGTWRLADGTLLEAGTLRSDKLSSEGWEDVSFEAGFDARPVVLSQVQTDNGSDFVVTRQKGADADGFQLTMQEEEALNGGGHTTETLGWIAIEAGAGSAGGLDWVAGRAGGIDDDRAIIDLSGQLPGGANAIAGLSSFAGADPAWARGDGGTGGRVGLSVEEEQSQDDETSHTRETVDYFAFNQAGTIQGYDDGLFFV